ncbi:hypothetical protein B0T26DRAFT_745497 [Lasiosphaeria miniovina]|uniref:F-box domain-containing protein n=1 Tax=Lasiosphaeria miniovina TaxID=1954250 RepID=A0AA40E9M1_9PEZI|nr:uncharacterized protein B0T26DRAFT_745497 [Lasiosphaeria miniovina]KAK0733459.1 hypothetical protein B0T26DRAFT_745497 [Lasiosphaeria miniovina]
MATVSGPEGDGRRRSIEKSPIVIMSDGDDDDDDPTAFERLPDEIIEQILQAADSNGFASLSLLNAKWRSVAQQAHLYAHHLASCPSYAMSHGGSPPAASENDLPRLRKLFAKEVKRNLFEAYLRPNKTVIKVISNSISPSSCPGGEGIQFNPSPKGHHLLAYNSSRIHVIDMRAPEIAVKREFKILRRPAATCINDEGSLLAVLLTEMQVDVYDLTETPPKRNRSIILDHSPRAIAISPCGSVLAAAYEGGIEVSSLNPGALSTDRRAVKCDGVDALTFSFDGTQILGTTVSSSQPNTVILTAPYYDPGSHMADDNISALWTTSILFPNTSRDCSHAVLIQHGKYEEAGWTFTYDRSFETFRAVRIDDLRNGTTYFTGPVPSPTCQAKLIPCTLPAASYYGELVSAGFQGNDIWLYGIPEDLDAISDTSNAGSDNAQTGNSLSRRNSGPSVRSAQRMQENCDPSRVPQWQILCDKLRNTFVGGYKIDELDGVNMVKWVADFGDSSMKERLVVAARGVIPGLSITDDEGIDFVDGGRLTVIDFDYGVEDGGVTECTIEVGAIEPEVLEEEHRDMDTEVAIVRRRTVAQRRGNRSTLMRAATTAARGQSSSAQSAATDEDEDDDPLLPRRMRAPPPPRAAEPPAVGEETETQSIIEEQEALDAPYSHASPRSGTTLRRAATAAAVNRRMHPQATAGHIEYRRADGRAEHPHESDADNWVPPPPPYQKDDPGDLPAFLRHAAIGPAAAPDAQTEEQFPKQQPTRNRPVTLQQPLRQPSTQQPARSRPLTLQPRRTQTVSASYRDAPPVPPIPPVPSLPASIPPVPPIPQVHLSVRPPQARAPQAPQDSQSPSHEREISGSSLQPPQDSGSRPGSSDSRYMEGENIYDVSPPDSPTARDLAASVIVGGPLASSDAVVTGAPISPVVSNQQDPRTLLRIQTAPAAPQSQSGRPPALDLHIPSPSVSRVAASQNTALATNSAPVRRLSNSMTWPLQNSEDVLNVIAGHPYSAPPVGINTDNMAQPFPLPRPDQLASLNNRSEAPKRLSGAFQRVPVGSRTSDEYRRLSYQRPLSQQQQYSQQQYPQFQQPRFQPYHAPALIYEPQPRHPQDIMAGRHQEEMPLIISTPKGVSGAFDTPDQRISGQRAETPILAPVPRHPRPVTQPAVLRPTMERLETIYSVASVNGGHHQTLAEQSRLRVPGAPESTSSTVRVASLNRKQSRAERSAAKNIADAKRRGWTGRSRSTRRKKKERDFDVASSAGWTDVTTFSTRSMGFGRRTGGSEPVAGQQSKGDRKCVVM